MSIDGTTLILSFLSPSFSAGPQKPRTSTASKIKCEKFLTKNLDSSLKNKYFSALIFQEREFFDH